MCVRNIHEPQAGVDASKVHIEGKIKFDAPVTPSLLCASGTWTMTEETVMKLRMPRASMSPPTSNSQDPDSEPVDDTTEHNNQDNEHEGSNHHADSIPCFDESSEDNPEQLDPRVRAHDESNAQSGRLACSKLNYVVDSQAEPDSLEAGKDG